MSVAAPVRRPRPPAGRRTAAATRPAGRAGARRHGLPATGAAWLVLLAVLLAGIVSVNVAALRASLKLDDATARAEELRDENATLVARVAQLSSPARIDAGARYFEMVRAQPAPGDYVDLRPPALAPRPAGRPPRPATAIGGGAR